MTQVFKTRNSWLCFWTLLHSRWKFILASSSCDCSVPKFAYLACLHLFYWGLHAWCHFLFINMKCTFPSLDSVMCKMNLFNLSITRYQSYLMALVSSWFVSYFMVCVPFHGLCHFGWFVFFWMVYVLFHCVSVMVVFCLMVCI